MLVTLAASQIGLPRWLRIRSMRATPGTGESAGARGDIIMIVLLTSRGRSLP
jgi:hypothetical protein